MKIRKGKNYFTFYEDVSTLYLYVISLLGVNVSGCVGGFLPSWIHRWYSTTPVAPSSTYKISTRAALMFWEWGHDTCDNVNVTMSPSLSVADVISTPLFPVISSTIRGYILLASWRMVCVVCGNVCAHKNQSGLSIDLAPEHRSQPWPGLPRQPNIQLTSPQALSAQPSLSNQQLGSSPHITILWLIFGWKVKKRFLTTLQPHLWWIIIFGLKSLMSARAQGFRP